MVSKRFKVVEVFETIDTNLGSWKAQGIAILDVNFKVWGVKGELSDDIFSFYEKFSLIDMHIGDTVSNNNTFMMKATDKIGVIIVMKDTHLAMLSAINLKGRINALSDLHELEKHIETEEKPKDAEKYLRNVGMLLEKDAEIFLKQEAYETALDLITLAEFYYLSANMLEKAKRQAKRALELCKEKEITNYHQTFALSCSEACNKNLTKAEEYWKQIQGKYTEQEKKLVNNALKEAKRMHSIRI